MNEQVTTESNQQEAQLINQSPEMPENSKGKSPKLTLTGLVVLLIVFVGAFYFLKKPAPTNYTPVTVTTDKAIKSTADLNKASSDLDTIDLTSFETVLQQNDSDSSAFRL